MIVIMTDVSKILATCTNVGIPTYLLVEISGCVAAEEISYRHRYHHVESLFHPCHPSVYGVHLLAVWVAAWEIQDFREVVVTMECTVGDHRLHLALCLVWEAVGCMKILAGIHLMTEGTCLKFICLLYLFINMVGNRLFLHFS